MPEYVGDEGSLGRLECLGVVDNPSTLPSKILIIGCSLSVLDCWRSVVPSRRRARPRVWAPANAVSGFPRAGRARVLHDHRPPNTSQSPCGLRIRLWTHEWRRDTATSSFRPLG